MPLKPGSGTKPFFGQQADILDEQGNPVADGEEGYLVLKRPGRRCCARSTAIPIGM